MQQISIHVWEAEGIKISHETTDRLRAAAQEVLGKSFEVRIMIMRRCDHDPATVTEI